MPDKSLLTNDQVALLAAALFCAPTDACVVEDVKHAANEFLVWLKGNKSVSPL